MPRRRRTSRLRGAPWYSLGMNSALPEAYHGKGEREGGDRSQGSRAGGDYPGFWQAPHPSVNVVVVYRLGPCAVVVGWEQCRPYVERARAGI